MKSPDEKPCGAIPELAEVIGAELLENVRQHAQRVWVKVYGLPLIQAELPKIWAAWETDEVRQLNGALPLYIRTWLQNADENRKREEKRAQSKPLATAARGRRPLRNTGRACVPSSAPSICAIHFSTDVCELEGRTA